METISRTRFNQSTCLKHITTISSQPLAIFLAYQSVTRISTYLMFWARSVEVGHRFIWSMDLSEVVASTGIGLVTSLADKVNLDLIKTNKSSLHMLDATLWVHMHMPHRVVVTCGAQSKLTGGLVDGDAEISKWTKLDVWTFLYNWVERCERLSEVYATNDGIWSGSRLVITGSSIQYPSTAAARSKSVLTSDVKVNSESMNFGVYIYIIMTHKHKHSILQQFWQ